MNNIDTVLLREQIKAMRDEVLNGSFVGLEEKYEYLFVTTPSIFLLIKDNEIDYTSMLEYLISSIEEINTSKDKAKATDVKHEEINEVLAETYLYPVLGRPEDQPSSSKK